MPEIIEKEITDFDSVVELWQLKITEKRAIELLQENPDFQDGDLCDLINSLTDDDWKNYTNSISKNF